MSRQSIARYRRSQQSQEPTLRLIVFQLRQHWFCLPLVLARRVIPASISGQTTVPGLAQLQQDNIPLVDIASLVYQETPLLSANQQEAPLLLAAANTAPSSEVSAEPLTSPQTILVIDPPLLGIMGLLVDGTPAIKRVKQSAFSPVPALYLIMNRLQGVNTLVNQGENQPPLFLLEIDTLLAKLFQP